MTDGLDDVCLRSITQAYFEKAKRVFYIVFSQVSISIFLSLVHFYALGRHLGPEAVLDSQAKLRGEAVRLRPASFDRLEAHESASTDVWAELRRAVGSDDFPIFR